MRLTLSLRLTGKETAVPLNYQYPISSFLYRTIERSDSKLSKFLHQKGYGTANKRFKLFTFGQLWARPFHINTKRSTFEMPERRAKLQLSFYGDEEMKAFILGSFKDQHFALGDPRTPACDFIIENVQVLQEPQFQTRMKYRAVTPVCLSTFRKGEKYAQYLAPDDHGYEDAFLNNLTLKTMTAAQHFGLNIDRSSVETLSLKVSSKSIRRKPITIKCHTPEQTRVIAYTYDFELIAPVEMHKVLYYAGVGEKCSQGFGFVEVV